MDCELVVRPVSVNVKEVSSAQSQVTKSPLPSELQLSRVNRPARLLPRSTTTLARCWAVEVGGKAVTVTFLGGCGTPVLSNDVGLLFELVLFAPLVAVTT